MIHPGNSGGTSGKARIVLADDHPILLAGLRNLVEAEGDFEVAGTAATGLAALKLIRDLRPDIAVIDISMPELNGILLARRVAEAYPDVRILVLTLHEDTAYLNQALEAGVRGFLLKRSASEDLMRALRAVVVGGLYVDPAVASRVKRRVDAAPRSANQSRAMSLRQITDRETEVLKLAALGCANKEIASRLEISVKTVETHKKRALDKLEIRTRTALVRFAITQGWLAEP